MPRTITTQGERDYRQQKRQAARQMEELCQHIAALEFAREVERAHRWLGTPPGAAWLDQGGPPLELALDSEALEIAAREYLAAESNH